MVLPKTRCIVNDDFNYMKGGGLAMMVAINRVCVCVLVCVCVCVCVCVRECKCVGVGGGCGRVCGPVAVFDLCRRDVLRGPRT